MSIAKVNLGVLEVDLERAAHLVKELLTVQLDAESKEAVKGLVEQVKRAYSSIVNFYVPFNQSKRSDEAFQAHFDHDFIAFKTSYFSTFNELDGICTRLHNALNDIISHRSYLSKVPVLKRKVEDFKNSANAWYTKDQIIRDVVNEFHRAMYDEMAEIDATFGSEPVSISRNKLNSLISKWDDKFLKLKSNLDEFEKLTQKLK